MAVWTDDRLEMTPLTEEEIREKYEKDSRPTNNGDVSEGKISGGGVKLLDQTRSLLGPPDYTHSEGLRLRKSATRAGGALESYDSDPEDGNEDSDDKTVDAKYGDKEDFQRPSKLDLIVGFLRFSNFLSCSTAVFGVAYSMFYSLSEPSADLMVSANLSTVYNIWSPITLSPSHQYSRQVRVHELHLYNLRRNLFNNRKIAQFV